jgi:putative ABC transport system substrate-binding protein
MTCSRRRRLLQGGLVLAGLGALSACGIRLPFMPRPARIPQIGYLSIDSDGPRTDAFRQGLRDLGYIEGQSILVEFRFAESRPERVPELAAELARLPLDLIVASPAPAARAASDAAPTLPIVVANGDPVGSGLIPSLARPGGNITGVTSGGIEITAKWLDLLKQAVPAISRVAVLSDPTVHISEPAVNEAERATRTLGLHPQIIWVRDPADLEGAFAAMRTGQADALVALPGGTVASHHVRIAGLAVANRLPAIATWRDFAANGGLLSYGANGLEGEHRAATHVDKILKGASPADIPMEQPTKFDFAINLKTAQALGLTIPQSVLQQATEIIQ